MFSRITLSLTVLIAVVIAPAAPIEFSKIAAPRHSCCPAMQMQMDPCQRCPVNSNSTNSSSSCCSVQSPSFNFYSNGTDDFVAGMTRIAFKALTNDRFTVRFQRPPVPPPRFTFS